MAAVETRTYLAQNLEIKTPSEPLMVNPLDDVVRSVLELEQADQIRLSSAGIRHLYIPATLLPPIEGQSDHHSFSVINLGVNHQHLVTAPASEITISIHGSCFLVIGPTPHGIIVDHIFGNEHEQAVASAVESSIRGYKSIILCQNEFDRDRLQYLTPSAHVANLSIIPATTVLGQAATHPNYLAAVMLEADGRPLYSLQALDS